METLIKNKDIRKVCSYRFACALKSTLNPEPFNLCNKEYCMFQEERPNVEIKITWKN
jgi:hypothetical protein